MKCRIKILFYFIFGKHYVNVFHELIHFVHLATLFTDEITESWRSKPKGFLNNSLVTWLRY